MVRIAFSVLFCEENMRGKSVYLKENMKGGECSLVFI